MYIGDKAQNLTTQESKFLVSILNRTTHINAIPAEVDNLSYFAVQAALDSIEYNRYYLNEAGNALATVIYNKLVK